MEEHRLSNDLLAMMGDATNSRGQCMRYSAAYKEETRRKLLLNARAIAKKGGVESTAIDDLMAGIGLTGGAISALMHTQPAPQTPALDFASLPQSACTDTKTHKLARLVRRHYDAELSKVALRTTQYRLLMEVEAHGPVRPCDLAETLSLSPSTLTRNLKPLVSNGWADLGPGIDGRTRSVCITAAGRQKCAEGLPRWTMAGARVHHLMGGQKVSALHALLEECLRNMSAPE
ncbi:MarR family winged helix-turn-helix transcriptional regulator [Variovorax sp. RT4R15]|uniref:MarR family winged helix-turn-helix transcriptional regulator n=1 Tax=Variovorax sp. RT4R15 TaxID=3443737 RepID=UPI003F463162